MSSCTPNAKLLQAVEEKERQQRELEQEQRRMRDQDDDGVSEAAHKHGIAAHPHVGRSDHSSTRKRRPTSEQDAWERERQHRAEQ